MKSLLVINNEAVLILFDINLASTSVVSESLYSKLLFSCPDLNFDILFLTLKYEIEV